MHAEETSLSVPLCRSAFRVGHQFPLSYLKETPHHHTNTHKHEHTFITLALHMRTVHRTCCSNRGHITSNVIPNLYLENTLDDTNMGCQHAACSGVVSGNRHLNSNTECVLLKRLYLSPPLQYAFKHFLTQERPSLVPNNIAISVKFSPPI